MIPGTYLDGCYPSVAPSVLVDATGWLDDPACWPALLHAVGGSWTAIEAFDVDRGDLDEMLTTMLRSDQWPVFSLDLGKGNRIHQVWRNFDGDSGWDYLLTVSGSDRCLRLAALEGCFFGPALSWPELVAAAQFPGTNRSPAERLLMLVPAMSDDRMPEDAAEIIAQAVTAVGGRRHELEVARELLASDRFWGTTAWEESDGVPVSLSPWATRGAGLPLQERRLIAEALAGE